MCGHLVDVWLVCTAMESPAVVRTTARPEGVLTEDLLPFAVSEGPNFQNTPGRGRAQAVFVTDFAADMVAGVSRGTQPRYNFTLPWNMQTSTVVNLPNLCPYERTGRGPTTGGGGAYS